MRVWMLGSMAMWGRVRVLGRSGRCGGTGVRLARHVRARPGPAPRPGLGSGTPGPSGSGSGVGGMIRRRRVRRRVRHRLLGEWCVRVLPCVPMRYPGRSRRESFWDALVRARQRAFATAPASASRERPGGQAGHVAVRADDLRAAVRRCARRASMATGTGVVAERHQAARERPMKRPSGPPKLAGGVGRQLDAPSTSPGWTSRYGVLLVRRASARSDSTANGPLCAFGQLGVDLVEAVEPVEHLRVGGDGSRTSGPGRGPRSGRRRRRSAYRRERVHLDVRACRRPRSSDPRRGSIRRPESRAGAERQEGDHDHDGDDRVAAHTIPDSRERWPSG